MIIWVTNVSSKQESPAVSTTRLVENEKFPSHSGKPKDDGFAVKDDVMVELGGNI
jgi:hypothetical protein